MNSMAQLQQMNAFQDQFGREKRKLRISVTDRCNFKCSYCMPEHPEWMKKHNLLSFEALYQFCDFMVRRGIQQIRITGGEPLLRQGVVHFIAQLQALRKLGLKRISMTTNGHYLKRFAGALKQAGLDDLNISLDSLNEAQFHQLTQKQLQPVLEGIAAAQKADFRAQRADQHQLIQQQRRDLAGLNFLLLHQIVHPVLIRSEENIAGCARFNLLGQC